MTSNLCVIPRDWSYPVRGELRSSLENPQTPLSYPAEWLLDMFNGGRTDSGIRVSETMAFQTVTFLSCVDLIAGTAAALPIHVFERVILPMTKRAAHRIAYDHDYYDLIHVEPNEEMSRKTFLKAYLCHALAWGAGFAEIQRDGANDAVAFWPRNPAKTRPRRLTTAVRLDPAPWRPFPVNVPAGKMVFVTTDGMEEEDQSDLDGKGSRGERIIPMEDMLHLPGLTFDGRIGQSVVQLARQTIGLALASEKFGAKYFANFARPGGILNTPSLAAPGTPAHDAAKRSWKEANGGENAHGVAVMPPGFSFQSISNNPEESQMTETKVHARQEIAAMFHVPARMVGDTAKASRASTEQENQEFLDFGLMPWLVALKLEWKRKLFPHRGIGRTPRNPFYIAIDTTSLVRGDSASRQAYNSAGKQWGYLNTNDVRQLEGENPIDEPWAEEYWMPTNMTKATTPVDPTHQDGGGRGEVPLDQEGEDDDA